MASCHYEVTRPFVLFAFPSYYPRGGALDAVGAFYTVDEARKALEELIVRGFGPTRYEFAHVLDVRTGKIPYAWEREPSYGDEPIHEWIPETVSSEPWLGTVEDPWSTE